jgi:uncharacterized protein YycO
MNSSVPTIKILFSTQKDPVSWLIRFFTWNTYSHVDVVFRDHVIGATAQEGVRVTTLREMKRKSSKWAIYEMECPKHHAFRDRIVSQIEKPYDFLGILGFFVRRNWQQENRWFCSELVAWASSLVGSPILTGHHHRITPGALTRSPVLKLRESSS